MSRSFAEAFLNNSYLSELEGLAFPSSGAPSPSPRVLRLNQVLTENLGLDADAVSTPEAARLLTGSEVPSGITPVALAYAGHQFGGFSPQLGDGRALLLGELQSRDGRRFDLQLKGSGRTVFARGGDGKATLGPVLREYLMGEAMAALGIPTTRALAVVATGELVQRERLLPGAVLARIASSHLRIGSFQFFAARKETDRLRKLVDYAVARHDPELTAHPRKAMMFLNSVCERQAYLVARWMQVGFIHGVMNTDNMTISGETIDYGPCAFMDSYDPLTVFSSIDRDGRYAFGNQPRIAQWNLARLAESLLPLIHEDSNTAVADATSVVQAFPEMFLRNWLEGMRAKLGLHGAERSGDAALVQGFLELLEAHEADYTLSFRALGSAVAGSGGDLAALVPTDALEPWLAQWRRRLGDTEAEPIVASMARVNPAVIARNHRVEEALTAAVEHEEFGPFERLLETVSHPFEDRPQNRAFMAPPPRAQQRTHRTFCGT